MLTYMLSDYKLVDIVREETRGAFLEGSEYPDIKYLEEKCPNLGAIWHETIRLSAYSSSVRYIIKDTKIGGKLLRKGHRVMLPNRQLHFDKKVFGDDVYEFRHTRFIDDKNLVRTASWRPFGGGITLCPGRFIAKQAVISFIAITLQRFDIEVFGEKNFPRMEDGSPVLGIMSRHADDDVSIRLTPRKSKA
jgi:cytochrome P450